MSQYFTSKEVEGLDQRLVDRLEMARSMCGVPFNITSGFRTPDQNAALKGAASDSAHLTGLAVDLRIDDDQNFFLILKGLLAAGFRRIGLYYTLEETQLIPRHIHVDLAIDINHPQQVIWSKIEQN